ncbi:MAG: CotH kinase family protein [Acholeplasmataceae bacterium]|nr:CotH kinase family protein [Acholeplasmataceae bacterium]
MKKGLLMLICANFILFLLLLMPIQKFHAQTNRELNPTLSHEGGYYTEAFDLVIHGKPDTDLFYTLDGSKPTKDSIPYTDPIPIEEQFITADGSEYVIGKDTNLSGLPLSMIKTSDKLWFSPTQDIFKATILKVVAIHRETDEMSDILTNTYFVSPDMYEKYTFPILSISTDIENLYDFETGIQIPGAKFDPSQSVEGKSNRTGNYAQKGDASEREVSVELFETDGYRSIQQNAGLRIHGGLSRIYPIKSYRLYARDSYDEQSTFDYPFFDQKAVDTYKRIILRNGGQAYQYTFFGDAFLHHLLEPLNLDIQYSTPIILFLNGEYFGIRNVRDRYDTDYLKYHYLIPENQVTILTGHAYMEDGSKIGQIHYQMAYNYAIYKDLSKRKAFDQLTRWIDIDNLIDYMIVELYTGNVDWPQNNILYWRKNVRYTPGAPYGHDGRWRFMITDLDASFGVSWGTISPTQNPFDRITGESWKTGRLFVNLLENESFKSKFVYRMIELMDTVFASDEVSKKLDEWTALYAPEMDEHIAFYGHPSSFTAWISYINRMETFAVGRKSYMMSYMEDYLDLNEEHDLEVLYDQSMGSLLINQRLQTSGYHQSSYYDNLPIEMIAQPDENHHFEGWFYEDMLLSESKKLILSPEIPLSIEARFALGTATDQPNVFPLLVPTVIAIAITLGTTGTLIYLLINKRKKMIKEAS